MKTIFRKSFVKDLKRHARNKELFARVQEIILEVEAAESMTTIKNLKRLKAEVAYYRIRVGAHRIKANTTFFSCPPPINNDASSASSTFNPSGLESTPLHCDGSPPQ